MNTNSNNNINPYNLRTINYSKSGCNGYGIGFTVSGYNIPTHINTI